MAESSKAGRVAAGPDGGIIVDDGGHALISRSATEAIYRHAGGWHFVLRGEGFRYEGDVAVSGTVTAAVFIDVSGTTFFAWEA